MRTRPGGLDGQLNVWDWERFFSSWDSLGGSLLPPSVLAEAIPGDSPPSAREEVVGKDSCSQGVIVPPSHNPQQVCDLLSHLAYTKSGASLPDTCMS